MFNPSFNLYNKKNHVHFPFNSPGNINCNFLSILNIPTFLLIKLLHLDKNYNIIFLIFPSLLDVSRYNQVFSSNIFTEAIRHSS